MTEAPDVVDVLLQDHRVLRELIARLDRAEQADEAQRAYAELVDALVAHEATERRLVLPALRAADASHLAAEHEEVDELVAAMRGLRPASFAFVKRACALCIDLTAHLDEEEELVFPLLRAG